MNRYARLVLLLVLVIWCLACVGAMYLWRYECLPWECVPDRSFPVEVLLIDESVFPPGWQADITGPSSPPNAPLDHYDSIERIELFFYAHGSVAFQEIHRFASVRGAAREFEHRRSIFFPSEAWVVPVELAYQSPTADRFYLACSVERAIPMCRAIWQYEEYFVRFNTHMSPEFMTYSDLERVLRAIDERMAFYLAEDGK